MLPITSFAEAHQALRKYYGKPATGPYTLERMHALMNYLDNPQDKVRVIHVAGTSGKTSTAYFIASLLKESGVTVGLSVSPHVDEVNERVQLNLVPLAEVEFCRALSEFLGLVEASHILPSYFECMVAFAYWEFARQQVDYAVIEVGLGGLLDATNVVTRADKVSVITDIGLDHTELLGDTLAQIAAQKAGIIQPGNNVFMYEQAEEIMAAVDNACRRANADLHVIAQLSLCKVADLPLFQERNFCLADAVAEWVMQRASSKALSPGQIRRAAAIYIPARMEVVRRGDKVIIIDGAHNAQKLQTLFESIHNKFPDQPISGLVGFVEGDKFRLEQSLQVVMSELKHMIVTTFYTEKDYPKRSVAAETVTAYCAAQNWGAIEAVADPAQALAVALRRPEPILLITGSFYLLNHIRPLLLDTKL